jgi:hypothetical protein
LNPNTTPKNRHLVIQYQPTRDKPRPATKSKTQKLQEQQAQTNREALSFSFDPPHLADFLSGWNWLIFFFFCVTDQADIARESFINSVNGNATVLAV